jgi:hypothetical protein
MSSYPPGATAPSITVRPSAAEKARFVTLARVAGISESALALMAIRAFLEVEGTSGPSFPGLQERASRTDRITIRLRPGDGDAVSKRAAQRGMKTSTYLAALVRAHLAVNPPLPAEELAAFKRSVAVLTELRRLLAQAARTSASTPGREELQRTRSAIAALEERTDDLARAALISWESRSV